MEVISDRLLRVENYLPRFCASAESLAYFIVNLFWVLCGDFLFLFLLPTPVSRFAMTVLYTISQQLLRTNFSSDNLPISHAIDTVFMQNINKLYRVSSNTAEAENLGALEKRNPMSRMTFSCFHGS